MSDVVIRVVDKGDAYVTVSEELWVTRAGTAWLVSALPLAPQERREVGVFRTELTPALLQQAHELADTGSAERIHQRGDAVLGPWFAQVRASARQTPWSTLVLEATSSTAADGVTVRFTLSAGGSRPTRFLIDRETFALVGDAGEVRYRGPAPDSLWTTTGTPLSDLFGDLVIEAGQSASVAFFAVPPEALPAHATVQLSVAAVTDEPDDALPYPETQATLVSAEVPVPR